MKDSMDRSQELFERGNNVNSLSRYLQSLEPDAAKLLASPSSEAIKLMQDNLNQMLGGLPESDFEVTVTTERESLKQLIAAAMVNGYFLRRAEERMGWEKQMALMNED